MFKRIIVYFISFAIIAHDQQQCKDQTTCDVEIINVEQMKTIEWLAPHVQNCKNGDRVYLTTSRQTLHDLAKLKFIKIRHNENFEPIYNNEI
jgi:hypothetical protein